VSAQLTHQEIQPNTTDPAAGHLTTDHPATGHPITGRPATGRSATGRPAARPAIGWRLRWAWYQIRLTVAEMNYASRRVAELQAPWTVDAQWHAK
jgi:hypothetical protein